jgi:4-alpha-glucanotransferase
LRRGGSERLRELVREALEALGIRRLLLAVHDLSLPGDPADDVGRGAPLSRGGRAFLRFAADLGFHGLQLGPQGETTPHDPSPYDATLFSRSTSSIALGPLVDEGLLLERDLEVAVAARPPGALSRAAHAQAHAAVTEALARGWERARGDRALQDRLRRFAARSAGWIERSELHHVFEALHGGTDWRHWPEPDRSLFSGAPAQVAATRIGELRTAHADAIGRFRFGQLLAHEQHQAFRAEARSQGVLLFGDLQIGIAFRDLWSYGALLAPGLCMGAPPSRTNPEGQPWGYGVLDPDLYGTRATPGPALALVQSRARKLLEEFDGVRVDHPHGLIDPWVYAAEDPDPRGAVQRGGRLFSSPEQARLSRWAIALAGQLDPAQPLYADARVRELTGAQVERYATLFDALVDAVRAAGRDPDDIVPEVLSTQPYPVQRVLERHGLGRFRVTQKASLRDPADVYRAGNARAEDWIMVGTHDTATIWEVAERWVAEGGAAERAASLASRLVPDERARARWAQAVAGSPGALARAQLADLFVGPAANVMIFFADLLGSREVYNRPGTIAPENWSMRIPPDFADAWSRAAREGRALDLPSALATAMRARGPAFAAAHAGLLAALDRHALPPSDPVRSR